MYCIKVEADIGGIVLMEEAEVTAIGVMIKICVDLYYRVKTGHHFLDV